MDVKVIDKGGKFVVNPHEFAFVDPDPVPEKRLRYEPGTIYKVKVEPNSWLETQINAGVICYCDEDGQMEDVPAQPKAEVPVVVANATAPAASVASAAPAPAGRRAT